MPELPEVETTKTSLNPLIGQQVTGVQVYQPKLRWSMPDNLEDLVGYTLHSIERRAKYLILNFNPILKNRTTALPTLPVTQKKLLVHLGMSGSLQQHACDTEKRKHDHLIIEFSDADDSCTQLHYHDPRRFGSVLWYEDYSSKLLEHLGAEPLSTEFTADYLYHLIQRTPTSEQRSKKRPIAKPIKSVIMEQQVVVGVGNIYATESLYLSGIHPATAANDLSYEQISVLVGHIKTILHKAIALGGSTLKDFTVASGQTGYFQQTLNVYGKHGETCPQPQCDTVLDNIKINGRASVYCPRCQPLVG